MSCNITLPPITPGDDYPLQFTFTLPDGTAEPQAGNSMELMVKRQRADADADALVDRVINAAEPDAALGIIRTPLTTAETRSMEGLELVFVQARRTAAGVKQSPLVGAVRINTAVIADD